MATDPTKADRGTTAILEIDGLTEPLRNIVQFSVSDDYLQVGDTMNALAPDPTGTLWKKLELFATYKFYLKNPNIDGGTPVLRQTGVIRALEQNAGLRGDMISLRGADLGWHLSSSAPVFTRLENATVRDITEKLLNANPDWGFQGVRDGNDLNRKLRQGRAGELRRLQAQVLRPFLVIQILPGQSMIQVIQEYARRDGLMVNVSADGWLQLSNPNYNQDASFQINYHRAGTAESKTNNVVEPTSVLLDGDKIFTEVTCVWDQLYTNSVEDPLSPNVGRHCAVYTRSTGALSDTEQGYGVVTPLTAQTTPTARQASPKFARRLVFADSEPMTAQQGARRAVWEAQRQEFDGFIYRAKVVGHSQNGKWITSDTMGAVNDSVRGVKGMLYAPSVRHDGDAQGGNTTYIEMRKPGLLTNAPLVLNEVKDIGNAIFVEVQVPG